MSENESNGEEVTKGVEVWYKNDPDYKAVEMEAKHHCSMDKRECINYLADAKLAMDRAADMDGGAMSSTGIAMFVGAIVALYNDGYRGKGNGEDMDRTIEELIRLAEKLTGDYPDEYRVGEAKYILENGKWLD